MSTEREPNIDAMLDAEQTTRVTATLNFESAHAHCFVGVIDYPIYAERLLPVLERARRATTAAQAMIDLRAFVAGIREKARRDDAGPHVDRIEVAVQGGRWHRGAAGNLIEATCIEQSVRMNDMIPIFTACMDFLYGWNEAHAETIYTFLGSLGDRTLAWASPTDTWRAILDPAELIEPANAMRALPPHELKRLFMEIENGEVFSEEDARVLADWWSDLRKMVSLAQRQEQGLLISVRAVS